MALDGAEALTSGTHDPARDYGQEGEHVVSLRTSSGLAIAALAAALLAVAPSQAADAQEEPEAVVQAFVDALNDGDIDAAMAFVAEDAVITLIDSHGSQAGFGKPAFEGAVGQGADVNRVIELTELSTAGKVVSGVAEIVDDECQDRYLQPFTFTFNDAGLIARADFTHDESDQQTVACLESLEPPPSEPPPGVATIDMAAQSGSNQTGVAFVERDGVMAIAGVFITPGAEGVTQPAHVHTGTCEAPGPIVQPLASVMNGSSSSFISVFPATDPAQGLIINVHKSEAEAGVYVSCGVLSAVAAATPTAAVPVPTVTAAPGVTAPSTGGGRAGSTGTPSWLVALAITGVAVTAGGVLTLTFRRR